MSRDNRHRGSYLRQILGPRLVLDLNPDVGTTIATGVSQLLDTSGQGNHVAQGTGAMQPSLVSNVLSGHAALRFNGSQFLSRLSFNGIAAGSFPRLYAVASWTGASPVTGALFSLGSTATLNRGAYLTGFGTDKDFLSARNGTFRVTNFASGLGNSSSPAWFDGHNEATTVKLAINGTERSSVGAGGSAGLDNVIDRVYLGVLEDGVTQPFTGDLFRCVALNAPPTTEQQSAIKAYFQAAYPALPIV